MGELKTVLYERAVSPEEFFSEGGCWAYASALGPRLDGQVWTTIEIPIHAWIEKESKCYDILSEGLSREELLFSFLARNCYPETVRQQARSLTRSARTIPLKDLASRYNPLRKFGSHHFRINWELAIEFAEEVITARYQDSGLGLAFAGVRS